MTQKRVDQYDLPETDRLDQLTPIDLDDTDDAFDHPESAPTSVNEADWIDQQRPVPLDDPGLEER